MPGVPSRLMAALSDRYRIERELGEGGTATVYLAEDLKHNRKVAIKVLKPELAAVLGAERFVQEITTTAQLQHPNILPLFDSGEADSFLYYVMPYVQGESLRERLDRDKQLPIPEAVSIARAVAGALDYAQRQGVIHRDIKPANILLQDGQPVVADFGIALAVSAAGAGRLTETGLSLGTPYYMSPEQATADRDPGPASDVYSLACVLYEMIAGDPPHTGSTAQAVLARILTDRPRPLTDFRETVPPNVAAAVARGLAKVPADRFESAAAFGAALEDAGFTYTPAADTGPRSAVVAGTAVPGSSRRTVGILAALLVLATGAAGWGWLRPAPEIPRLQARLDIQVSPASGPDFAISPDGTRIVYRSGSAKPELRIRSLGSPESQVIPGTEGARAPAFSPDGNSIAFNQGVPPPDDSWHTVSLSGGSPIQLGTPGDPVSTQAAWSEDGFVYYERDAGKDRGIMRASSQGGAAERIPAKKDYGRPATIPGVTDRILAWGDGSGYGFLDVADGQFRPVKGLEAATDVAVAGQYLFWTTTDGALVAARFDVRGEKLASAPVTLAQGVADEGFAVSQTGTLVYTTGDQQSVTSLVWVDDTGHEEVVDSRLAGAFPRPIEARVSPDGAHLALTVRRSGTGGEEANATHLVVYDVGQKSWQQLTFEGTTNIGPRWLPDGRIVFLSDQDSAPALWVKPFDRSATETLLFRPSAGTLRGKCGWDVSPVPGDPMVVCLVGADLPDGTGLYLVDPVPGAQPHPFLTSRSPSVQPAISPDGHWVAYVSGESGQPLVYVRRYPGGGPPFPVSLERGTYPAWGPTSAELYYRTPTELIEAHLDVSHGFRVTGRKPVVGDVRSRLVLGGPAGAAYDVGKDGRIVAIANAVNDSTTAATLPVVVQDVFREVRERLAGQGGG